MSFEENSLQPNRRQADHAASEADSQAVVVGGHEGVDEGVMEGLMESRYASLERLVAMQVMFYHMAARVATFWYVHMSAQVAYKYMSCAYLLCDLPDCRRWLQQPYTMCKQKCAGMCRLPKVIDVSVENTSCASSD